MAPLPPADKAFDKPAPREKLDERLVFMGTDSMANAIDEEANARNETRSDVIRRAVELYFNPRPVEIADGYRTWRAKYLASVPCGPWQAAVEEAGWYTINTATADELEARDGDVWVRAAGTSMEGAGILDDYLVLVRPYEGRSPRRGDIVLVQVTDQDGQCSGTLKRFNGMDGILPRLIDGHDNPFPLPEHPRQVELIARAVGVIGRI